MLALQLCIPSLPLTLNAHAPTEMPPVDEVIQRIKHINLLPRQFLNFLPPALFMYCRYSTQYVLHTHVNNNILISTRRNSDIRVEIMRYIAKSNLFWSTCLLQPAVRHPQHQFGLVYRKQDTSPHSFVAVGQMQAFSFSPLIKPLLEMYVSSSNLSHSRDYICMIDDVINVRI